MMKKIMKFPLHEAAQRGDLNGLIVHLQGHQHFHRGGLVTKTFDVNQATRTGDTALHIAAGNGDLNMVELLLECKARVDLLDNMGRSPLDRAVAKSHQQVVTFLTAITHGLADVNLARGHTGGSANKGLLMPVSPSGVVPRSAAGTWSAASSDWLPRSQTSHLQRRQTPSSESLNSGRHHGNNNNNNSIPGHSPVVIRKKRSTLSKAGLRPSAASPPLIQSPSSQRYSPKPVRPLTPVLYGEDLQLPSIAKSNSEARELERLRSRVLFKSPKATNDVNIQTRCPSQNYFRPPTRAATTLGFYSP